MKEIEHAREHPFFNQGRGGTPTSQQAQVAQQLANQMRSREAMQNYVFSAKQRMHPDDALEMYRIGHKLGKLCDRAGIVWWVTDGSLLGMMRNKGIIPHDDDMDYNVLEEQIHLLKTKTFQEQLHRNNLHLVVPGVKDRLYIWKYDAWREYNGNVNGHGVKMKLDLWPVRRSGGTLHQITAKKSAWPEQLCVKQSEPQNRWSLSFLWRKIRGKFWNRNYRCALRRRKFGSDYLWAPSRRAAETYLHRRYGKWDETPLCQGTLHHCNLIKDKNFDMTGHAQPTQPLISIQ
jgi:hypothetical protein